MMDEAETVRVQLRSKLAQVSLDRLSLDMDQRVETEDEIDGVIRNAGQAVSLIPIKPHLCIGREPFLACLHTPRVRVDEVQLRAIFAQIMAPATKPRPDLDDRVCR